jgi:hypothetical protein
VFCGADMLFPISRSRSWILSRAAVKGGSLEAFADEGLEVTRCVLI